MTDLDHLRVDIDAALERNRIQTLDQIRPWFEGLRHEMSEANRREEIRNGNLARAQQTIAIHGTRMEMLEKDVANHEARLHRHSNKLEAFEGHIFSFAVNAREACRSMIDEHIAAAKKTIDETIEMLKGTIRDVASRIAGGDGMDRPLRRWDAVLIVAGCSAAAWILGYFAHKP